MGANRASGTMHGETLQKQVVSVSFIHVAQSSGGFCLHQAVMEKSQTEATFIGSFS